MWYHIPCTSIWGVGHLEATQPIDPEIHCYVMLCYVDVTDKYKYLGQIMNNKDNLKDHSLFHVPNDFAY